MKPTDTLTTIFSHNRWANLRLLERCAVLTDEHLDATVLGTFGSIRDTLQHFVRSEASYLYRISTGQPLPRPDNPAPLTISQMIDSLGQSGAGLIEWASKVQADDSVSIKWVDGSQRAVPKTIILNQAINHATEHRSQIMTILTQLGVEPPELDSWSYFDQM